MINGRFVPSGHSGQDVPSGVLFDRQPFLSEPEAHELRPLGFVKSGGWDLLDGGSQIQKAGQERRQHQSEG